jgi:AcrR family transcriptional regulator
MIVIDGHARQAADERNENAPAAVRDPYTCRVSKAEIRIEGSTWQTKVVSRALDRAAERSLERGRGFIKAATELLETSEDANFTVQQVADAAGQSLRTLYQHFSSKDDLLLAVFEDQVERYVGYVATQVEKYDKPLDRLTAALIASVSGRDHGVRTIALARYRMELAITHPDEIAVVQVPFVSLIRQLVMDAVEAGAIPPCDVDQMAYLITTLKSAYIHSMVLGNELGVEAPTPVGLAKFCLEGLGTRLPSAFTEGLP